jgi:hypothetical protein
MIYEAKDLDNPEEHSGLRVLHAIKNAYLLARQTGYKSDEVKAQIRRLILNFNADSSSSFALRMNLVELMLNEKRIFSSADFVDIEHVCLKLAEKLKSEKRIHNAISIYELGEKVETRLGRKVHNWRKSVAVSFEALMNRHGSDSILSLYFCQHALRNYKMINDLNKIAELESRLAKLKDTVQFKEVKIDVDMARELERCKDFAKTLARRSPEEIIRFLMFEKEILPTYKEMEQLVKEETQKYPLISLFPTEIIDQRGNVPEHFGGDEEKKYHRILENYKIFLEISKMPLINSIFFETARAQKLTLSDLLNFFRKHSWFGKDLRRKIHNQVVDYNWLGVIAPSLNEYFTQMEYCYSSYGRPNFVLAIDSLTLKIEGLVRDICTFSEVVTFYMKTDKQNRSVTMEKDIQALLHEQKLKELIDEDDLLFLRFLLVEKVGYTLRHNIAHSFMLFNDYSINLMHLLIIALLKIGKYDFTNKQLN